MTASITVLQHSDGVPIGLLEPALRAHGVTCHTVRLDRGEPVPQVGACGDGLIVLGGLMSAYDDEQAPWLPAVRDLLRDAVAADLPVLGICLGAQLLAVAFGGTVDVGASGGLEAGVIDISWRQGASTDPVLSAASSATAAVSFHYDAVSTLPSEAVWLASSDAYPHHAFRIGSALGVQFHPEWGSELLLHWAERTRLPLDAIAQDLLARAHELDALTEGIAVGFAQVVAKP